MRECSTEASPSRVRGGGVVGDRVRTVVGVSRRVCHARNALLVEVVDVCRGVIVQIIAFTGHQST